MSGWKTTRAMKRALLVGIDEYDRFAALDGCVNDVDALEPLLRRNDDDSPNFDRQKRTSVTGGVTRDALLDDLDALLGGGADVALLYFAGHGAGSDTDVALVTRDATPATPGIAFSEVLAKVAHSSVRELVVILDCCFSGAAGGISSAGELRHDAERRRIDPRGQPWRPSGGRDWPWPLLSLSRRSAGGRRRRRSRKSDGRRTLRLSG
jgi:hypothetical protein